MHENFDYITLVEAAKLAPSRPSTNCIWRWCRRGVLSRGGQRVRLHHVRIGGKIYTTAGWLHQFGQSLADADAMYFDLDAEVAASCSDSPRPINPRLREADIQRAEHALKAAGA